MNEFVKLIIKPRTLKHFLDCYSRTRITKNLRKQNFEFFWNKIWDWIIPLDFIPLVSLIQIKRKFPDHHFKENNPQRPNVSSASGILNSLVNFWSHIVWRTTYIVDHFIWLELDCKSEIYQMASISTVFLFNHYVVHFQIPVENILSVEIGDSFQNVSENHFGLWFLHPTIFLLIYKLTQGVTLAELKHQVLILILFEKIKNLDDLSAIKFMEKFSLGLNERIYFFLDDRFLGEAFYSHMFGGDHVKSLENCWKGSLSNYLKNFISVSEKKFILFFLKILRKIVLDFLWNAEIFFCGIFFLIFFYFFV